MSRREPAWKPGPIVASLLLHAVVVGALALAGPGEPTKEPQTKVYAVDIVSPPPNMAGAPPLEALGNQEPGPAAQPAPAAEMPAAEAPAPEPAPPAPQPDPEPAPPPREAPKEPQTAPEPRRTPPETRPAQPTPRPSTPAQRPSTTTRPTQPSASTTRPAATPEKGRATPTPEKGRTTTRPTTGSSTTGGTGSGPNRTRGDGTSTAPATGSNPQANSPGGEGMNIHVEGEPCPVAGFCEQVQVRVTRFFRAPAGTAGARGEVCFRIQRDGSVTDVTTRNLRGGAGAAFRLAMMEAAEAAGSRRAFGALPGAFDPQRWRWCVELSPR